LWHHYTLTIPAGTTEAEAVEKSLDLTYGVIKYLGVGFPKGCKQRVKVRVYHREHQIFPNNSDEPASWDGGIEGGEQHYRLDESPFVLLARGYSPTAVKDHDVTILINVLPMEVAEPWREQISLLDRIKNVFGLG
jgi:hypothetical protein